MFMQLAKKQREYHPDEKRGHFTQGYMGSAGMLLATVGAPFDIGIVARILDEQ